MMPEWSGVERHTWMDSWAVSLFFSPTSIADLSTWAVCGVGAESYVTAARIASAQAAASESRDGAAKTQRGHGIHTMSLRGGVMIALHCTLVVLPGRLRRAHPRLLGRECWACIFCNCILEPKSPFRLRWMYVCHRVRSFPCSGGVWPIFGPWTDAGSSSQAPAGQQAA